MYYYGGGNPCYSGASYPTYSYPVYNNNSSNSFAIILVLFILLVVVIGAGWTR